MVSIVLGGDDSVLRGRGGLHGLTAKAVKPHPSLASATRPTMLSIVLGERSSSCVDT